MNEQKQMIEEVEKEECEHFDKEVCSRLNCKKDCKYYGKSNCYRCNHKEICQLRAFSYCEEEVKENGCKYYQQEIPENAVVLTKGTYFSREEVDEISETAIKNSRKETAEKVMEDCLRDALTVSTRDYGSIEVVPLDRINEICENIIKGDK